MIAGLLIGPQESLGFLQRGCPWPAQPREDRSSNTDNVSYGHIHTLTLRAGESQTVAMLMPVQVDALMFVGALYVDHAKTAMGKTFAWASFVVGFLASFAANYLATAPTILGKGAGIMTALALLFAAGTVHWGNKKAKPKPRAKVSPAVRKASEPRPAFVGELDTDVLAVAYR